MTKDRHPLPFFKFCAVAGGGGGGGVLQCSLKIYCRTLLGILLKIFFNTVSFKLRLKCQSKILWVVFYQQTTFETLYKLSEEIQQKEMHQKLGAQKGILKFFV
jgi:hypothetical protein